MLSAEEGLIKVANNELLAGNDGFSIKVSSSEICQTIFWTENFCVWIVGRYFYDILHL